MCRFAAYLGNTPIVLNRILSNPQNSLVNQSKKSREGKNGTHADGFGIGWYDQTIGNTPGIFKSIQPAWNDENLHHLTSKMRSKCFVGHVRASTVGNVNTFNCHPFSYQEFLFAHNGTIRNFDRMRRKILGSLSNPFFEMIRGQTDSEYFFALVMDILHQNSNHARLNTIVESVILAIDKINKIQKKFPDNSFSRLNTVLTDGKCIVATRYTSSKHEDPLSLYYTTGDHINIHDTGRLMNSTQAQPGAILIASEPLSNFSPEWKAVPTNHLLAVDENLHIKSMALF